MSAPGDHNPEQLVKITTNKLEQIQLFLGHKESLLMLSVFTSAKLVYSRWVWLLKLGRWGDSWT